MPKMTRSIIDCGKHWDDYTSAEMICCGLRLHCADFAARWLNWVRMRTPSG